MSKRRVNHHPRTMSEVLRLRPSQTNDIDASQSRPDTRLARPSSSSLALSQPNLTLPRLPLHGMRSSSISRLDATSGTESEGPMMSSSTLTKRGQGRAKGITTWGGTTKFDVQFDEIGTPIGSPGKALTGQLGIMVRNAFRIPLTYVDWSHIPQDKIDSIWQEVQENLVDCPDRFRDVCMTTCKNLWRNNKHKMKMKYFKPISDHPDIYSKGPTHIPISQWKDLVDYWRSEKAQEISEKNSINRELRGPTHTTGRTAFSEIRREIAEKGDLPLKIDVFKKTRNLSDPDVAALIVNYEQLINKRPEAERTREFQDNVYNEVFGKDTHGYCRTYGASMPWSAVYQKKAGPSQLQTGTSDEMQILIEKVEQNQENMRKFEAEIVMLRARIAFLESRGGSTSETIQQVPDGSSGHPAFVESTGEDTTPSRHNSTPRSPSP